MLIGPSVSNEWVLYTNYSLPKLFIAEHNLTGFNSVSECFPSMYGALGSIPSNAKKKTIRKIAVRIATTSLEMPCFMLQV